MLCRNPAASCAFGAKSDAPLIFFSRTIFSRKVSTYLEVENETMLKEASVKILINDY